MKLAENTSFNIRSIFCITKKSQILTEFKCGYHENILFDLKKKIIIHENRAPSFE